MAGRGPGDLVQLEHKGKPLFPPRPASRAGTMKQSFAMDLRALRQVVLADRQVFGPPPPGPVPVDGRPRTRADCMDGPRPCPWISCRFSLAVDVTPHGGLQFTVPGGELEDLPETCALDVAERGGITQVEIAGLLNMSRSRVEQIETRALARLRRQWPSGPPWPGQPTR